MEQGQDQPMKLNESEFVIGFDNPQDPNVMVFTAPLGVLAKDMRLGTVLLRGEFEEAKQIALDVVRKKRMRMAEALGPSLVLPKSAAPMAPTKGTMSVV